MTYPSGNGGFGGGLESRKIDSVLWLLRTIPGACDVCSNISRSLGVSGMSGSEFLWIGFSVRLAYEERGVVLYGVWWAVIFSIANFIRPWKI